jgi:seryl-tRNA synthetase
MKEQKELEKLQSKRAELEAESHSLKEEQTKLEYSIRVLEEKVMIEEISDNNKATKDAISKLEAKLCELKNRLKEKPQTPPQSPAPPPPVETKTEVIVSPEAIEEAPVPAEAVPESPKESIEENIEDSCVTVTAIDDEALVETQEAKGDNQQEKKKRRFF